MGIDQIALDPTPPSAKRAKVEKSAPNYPGKRSRPSPPYGQCPYRTNTFQKGASLRKMNILKVWEYDITFLEIILMEILCKNGFGGKEDWLARMAAGQKGTEMNCYICANW